MIVLDHNHHFISLTATHKHYNPQYVSEWAKNTSIINEPFIRCWGDAGATASTMLHTPSRQLFYQVRSVTVLRFMNS